MTISASGNDIDNLLWRNIPGFPKYQAHPLGLIISIDCVIKTSLLTYNRKGRILKSCKDSNGYMQVSLMKPGKSISTLTLVHRLILLTFIENTANKPFVNHKDGDKSNNRLDNLEWCTRSENAIHSFKIRLQCNKGENHPAHKLKNEDVISIRNNYKRKGNNSVHLSKQYQVSRTTIKDIVSRKIWKHI